MKTGTAVKESGWRYLLLSLGAFLGIVLEAVHAFGWEPIVFGRDSFAQYTTWQALLHWILTCLTWSAVGFALVRTAKRQMGFDIFQKREKMKAWQLLAAVAGILLSVAISCFSWEGFKVVREFQSNGPLLFTFQYLYYLFETALVLLIIVFGQKAFELWTKRQNIPWGGIICGLTWGVIHVVSRGVFDVENGLLSTLSGFLFGAAYLLANRDVKKTWLIMCLMFVL